MKRSLLVVVVLGLLASACQLPLIGGYEPRTVEAVVSRSNNLFEGSDVRVLGLRVGQVTSIEAQGPNVLVRMTIDPDVELPADVGAVIVPVSLLGERYVQLDPPYTGGPTLPEGEVIPIERTGVPAEVDEVLASFERFLEGLDSETLGDLVDVVAETLGGQGDDLNQLLDQGSTTVRVLADSSDDLMGVVSEFATLNESLATRDQQIGQVIEDWSTVVRTISEESDEIIDGVDNLRRLAVALRRILDEHADPLVGDLETLTTTLSTVERNTERLATLARGGRLLFEGAGRAFEYENARLALNNRSEYLTGAVVERLSDRLVGLCLRLDVDECASAEFWDDFLVDILCLDDVAGCEPDPDAIADAIGEALGMLPVEALDQLAEEQREREAAAADEASEADEPTSDPDEPTSDPDEDLDLDERLPEPEIDLDEPDVDGATSSSDGLRDRFARWIGAGR